MLPQPRSQSRGVGRVNERIFLLYPHYQPGSKESGIEKKYDSTDKMLGKTAHPIFSIQSAPLHQTTPNQSETRLKIPSTPHPRGYYKNRRPSGGSMLQSGGKSTQVTMTVSTSGKMSVTGSNNGSKKPRRNLNAAPTATTKVQPQLSGSSLQKADKN
ncbi:6727_t:CDS:2 [Paraglomus brasilianum]|uniref:6727_t:CDS:1 n=1 Tax=Paraglomus brasilianum TaxID=144538 RepID=A0A9N9CKM1_9GLOM|nr:6727_t:CDS:2 [Paraglomus brasilianum]